MRIRKYTILQGLPKTLPLLLKKRVEENPNINIQAAKNKNGKYEFYTYGEFYENVIAFSYALKKIGVTRGSNVALI